MNATNNKEYNYNKEYPKEIVELVKARLKSMPDNLSISIGSEGNFNKKELVKMVEQGNDIGNKMIELDLEFLRALKTGDIYNIINNANN